MPVIPGFSTLGQKNHKFETSLGYIIRPCHKEKKHTHSHVVKLAWEKLKLLILSSFPLESKVDVVHEDSIDKC